MRIITRLAPIAILIVSFLSIVHAQDIQAPVNVYDVEVVAEYSHDSNAFTQGLLLHDGLFYESTGNPRDYTTSVREVDPETGEVLRIVDMGNDFFGEGLARVDDHLIQLSWTAGVARIFDIETFEEIGTFDYEGEGWGLCYDGSYLYMSDGSSFLTIRDPETFDVMFKLAVTYKGTAVELLAGQDGASIGRLNELECTDEYVYANAYTTDIILQIDKIDGRVVGIIDASGLLTEEENAALVAGSEVLNGIAYNPESDTLFLTGKGWPKVFEVNLTEYVAETDG